MVGPASLASAAVFATFGRAGTYYSEEGATGVPVRLVLDHGTQVGEVGHFDVATDVALIKVLASDVAKPAWPGGYFVVDGETWQMLEAPRRARRGVWWEVKVQPDGNL